MKKLDLDAIELQWDNVLIRQDELVQQTSSGLILPGSEGNDKSVLRGTVLAVGPGRTDPFGVYREQEYQVGQEVLYPAHWTRSFALGASNYDILPQDRIFGRLTCPST